MSRLWRKRASSSIHLPLFSLNRPCPLSFTKTNSVEYGELRQFLRLDEAPVPSTTNDDVALSELSPEEAAKLAAELEAGDTSTKVPIQPTSDGVQSAPEAQGVSEVMVENPGQAEAEGFETGMS